MSEVAVAQAVRDAWKFRVARVSVVHVMTMVLIFIFVFTRLKITMPDWLELVMIVFFVIELSAYLLVHIIVARAEAVLTEAIIADRDREIAP